MTTAEGLRAAGELLRTKGWCQQVSQDRDGRHCAIGAIMAVFNRYEQRHAIAALSGIVGCSLISEWNDAPERTEAEVVAAFERAAAGE